MDGWEGGWVGRDNQGPSIFLKLEYGNKRVVMVSNIDLKVTYGH